MLLRELARRIAVLVAQRELFRGGKLNGSDIGQAMPGTAFGLTNETIWMWSSPVCASASTSAILRTVAIGPFSIWKPSRGPSSVM
jgi:hypothetical protein